MKTKVLQENFTKALSSVSRFVSPRAQLPILGNILLRASKTKLIIAATNLEISASFSIGAQTEKEGETTIPGRVISEVIANLSPGGVSLEAEKEQLKIKTDSFSSTVLGMDSSDFPAIPNTIDPKKANVFPLKEFKNAVSSVIFASSTDETRPTLTGVLLIFNKKELTFVATDGFRLSQKKIQLVKEQKPGQLILPKSILLEILRTTGEEEQLIFAFNQTDKQVLFGTDEAVLSSRVIEGEFPNFEKIIPKDATTKIVVNKSDLGRAVKLASVFARESANVVKFQISKENLIVSAESSSAGSQETKVDANIQGPEVEIAFNFRFLEDFLHATGGEDISISFSGATSPAVFTDPKNPDYLHLIMPVRVQS